MQQYNEDGFEKEKLMNNEDVMKLFTDSTIFWSKLGFCHDPPRLDEAGNPIVFFNDFERFEKYHNDFTKAGVKIHTSILFNGWIGVDTYDYRLTDRVLDSVFKDNPGIYYIPRIKLNVPLDWGKANPEHMCVYFGGPDNVDDIRGAVNTSAHDILGYESPTGYYTAGGWMDKRPNVGGVISNQSFSSTKWLAGAGEALLRLLDHLEKSQFKDRIIAYHIAYGVSGETCLWGRFGLPVKFADYGIFHRRAFFFWGLKKYKTLDILRTAWNNPLLNEENALPPPPELREGNMQNLRSFLRGNTEQQICIDYDLFMSDVNVDAMEHFGKIIKTKTDGKPVGVFYGYYLEISRSAYTGHLGFERLLKSPFIDFIAAPKSYYRSNPGDPGGELAPAQSINLKKLWIDEIDIRTHLCITGEKQCHSFAETKSVLWREFSKNLAHGSGFWWMDLGGGWFDSPEVLNEIKNINNLLSEIRSTPGSSVSEVLLITDEQVISHYDAAANLQYFLLQETIREFHLCGSPIDIYRLSDLPTIDLTQYRLFCFLNVFMITGDEWQTVQARLPDNPTLFWFFTPGILSPQFCLDNVRKLTGFTIKERDSVSPIYPVVNSIIQNSPVINPPDDPAVNFPVPEIINASDITILAKFKDGGIAVAERKNKNGRQIYSVLPLLKMDHLRIIMKYAGCHMYAPPDCTVYADNRFISIFPRKDMQGQLILKGCHEVRDCMSGKIYSKAEVIPLGKKNTVNFFRYSSMSN